MKNKKKIAITLLIASALLASCGLADGGETTGNGVCTNNNGGCSANAQCIQISTNNRSCVCNSGYSGNGVTCTQNTGGGGGGNTGGDEGQGFGNGPWNVTVSFPGPFTLNGCAGRSRSNDVFSGGFDCMWNAQYESIASGSGSVSFTIPDQPQMTEPLRLFLNLRKADGNYVAYLSSDTVFIEGGLSITVKGQSSSYATVKDTQRRTGCPNGCPNIRLRLR